MGLQLKGAHWVDMDYFRDEFEGYHCLTMVLLSLSSHVSLPLVTENVKNCSSCGHGLYMITTICNGKKCLVTNL